jgi:hypothetical protein
MTTLPREIVLVDWEYDPGATFSSLDTLAIAGLDRVVTSPGLWDWSTVYPDQSRARDNIAAATRAARAHGCLGSVLASWGDGGGESLFGNAVPGLAWFAECAWGNASNPSIAPSASHASAFETTFLPRYCRLRFGGSAGKLADALRELEQFALPDGAHGDHLLYHPILLRHRTPAWRDAIAGITVSMERARTALAAARLEDVDQDLYAGAELESLRASSERLLAAAGRELALDSLSATIDAAPAGDPAAQARAAAVLGRIAAAERSAQAAYARAWRAHNREAGLSALEARFAIQAATLDSLRVCATRRELRCYEPPGALQAEN